MIEAVETDSGVTFSVRAQPNAKKNAIVGKYGGRIKIAVAAVPEKGKANKAIADLIAKELNIKNSQVNVVSGLTSKDKKIHITGLSIKDLKGLEL